MTCPEHHIDVEQCNCATADALLEYVGKQIDNGKTEAEADAMALKMYEDSLIGQFSLEL